VLIGARAEQTARDDVGSCSKCVIALPTAPVTCIESRHRAGYAAGIFVLCIALVFVFAFAVPIELASSHSHTV